MFTVQNMNINYLLLWPPHIGSILLSNIQHHCVDSLRIEYAAVGPCIDEVLIQTISRRVMNWRYFLTYNPYPAGIPVEYRLYMFVQVQLLFLHHTSLLICVCLLVPFMLSLLHTYCVSCSYIAP